MKTNEKKGPLQKPSENPVPLASIEVFTPYHFDDCQFIADALKKGSAAIVNFYYLMESDSIHMRSFLEGCVSALDGSHERISKNIDVYMPRAARVQVPEKRPFH